jgi:hypothetical protein
MITLRTTDGHLVELYEPLDAQEYLGGISANTLSRWRRWGYFNWAGVVSIGRGYAYTKATLDECRKLKNLDTRNKEVRYE